MSALIRKPGDPTAAPIPAEAPRAPTEAQWAAMSPAQREQAVRALLASESQEELDEREAMAEGDPHLDAKMEARDTPSRIGRYRSEVLDLDLTVESGRLRFYTDTAELVTAGELVGKLERMIEAAEARIEREQARAEQALERLSAAILMVLGARGIPASEEAKGRILSETDLSVLERWLQRAATATAVEELFLESAGR